ncbi:hypothetical protein I2492_11200 [Budviciaceae bacterium CWB-B4]|uniref:Uncharacterized protein n=1 Tax=Limnobaculum xujianqingii TaxID=2738837 RepID=A0A9D7AJ07_9GAMM|nr:hypothetical protein [Limnobaculum xujianqingii]MBK5073382.1 hypothetical protein [Limnobaculum xujianqingii]MBK5176887.1 hypothetical protein [Limnobaculum xujianqingii]
MDMISYWKNPIEIYVDDGLVLIIGYYDHKNQYNGGEKELGVHWGNYPQSRGILSPCVIPATTRSAILSGLLHQAVATGDSQKVSSITKAIEFFNT